MSGNDWSIEILTVLAQSPLASSIRIFGSAADPSRQPKDIDAFVEIDGLYDRKDVQTLLSIAYEKYGMFDPFLLSAGVLWTRSNDATRWVKARNAHSLTSAGRTGISVDEALDIAQKNAATPKP